MNVSSDIKSLPPLRNPEILIGANDLTTLSYLHEPAGEKIQQSSKSSKGTLSLPLDNLAIFFILLLFRVLLNLDFIHL